MTTEPDFPPDWLSDSFNQGYGSQPIPVERDQQISELLRTWSGWTAARRTEAADRLSEVQVNTLLGYADRMASLAVREHQEELVVLGLVALAIDYRHGDVRDTLIRLARLWDAAGRVAADPKAIFIKASDLLEPEIAKEVVGKWLDRSAELRSLDVMGSVAGSDSDGFRYVWKPWTARAPGGQSRSIVGGGRLGRKRGPMGRFMLVSLFALIIVTLIWLMQWSLARVH